jgi:Zn-dependent protease with chaperone function
VRIATSLSTFFLALLAVLLALIHAGPLGHVGPGALVPFAGLAAYAPCGLIRLRLERRLQSRPLGALRWFGGILLSWLILFPFIFLVPLVIFVSTEEWEPAVFVALGLALLALFFFLHGGGLLLARLLGLARPAGARLRAIVEQAASRTGVRPLGVYELRWRITNAFAFPLGGRLAFTDTLLAKLTDEEVGAIAAHEMGHLGEPRRVALLGTIPGILFLALGTARPFIHSFGPGAFMALGLGAAAVAILFRRVVRRLEVRADAVAHVYEGDPGAYARALEKTYAADLTPVVLASKGTTHPNLYDRLLAAGVTPPYARPLPPSRFRALVAVVVSVALALGSYLGLEWARFRAAEGREHGLLWAIALDGGSADSLARLAWQHYERGDRASAALLYRAAGAAAPTSAAYPANEAVVLANLGRCAEAERALAEAEDRYEQNGQPAREERALRNARAAVEQCRGR